MTSESLVDIVDLEVSIAGNIILHDVSLAIDAGKIVTLIGPNGAGKTTLAQAILGLVKAQKGKIIRRKKLQIGYMPQKVHIDPTLPISVKKFLSLSQVSGGLSIEDALEMVKAKVLLKRPMAGLSGGELQRVLLVKAIMRRPNLLVLDEPVQGVDLPGQSELYKLIEGIKHKFKCGVLIISHDLHMVLGASDYVVCLNKHVCCAGTPRSVTEDPYYRKLFGDMKVPYGLVPYAHEHDHSHDDNPDVEGYTRNA